MQLFDKLYLKTKQEKMTTDKLYSGRLLHRICDCKSLVWLNFGEDLLLQVRFDLKLFVERKYGQMIIYYLISILIEV